MHKRGWHLFRYVNGVLVCVGLHILVDDGQANGDEVTSVILAERMVVHLAM